MVVLRSIWAIIVGTFVAAVLGMAYDYLRPTFIPNPAEYQFVYPWMTGIAGLLAAVIVALMTAPRQAAQGSAPPKHAKSSPVQQPAGSKAGAAVTGMPGFDFDKARSEIDAAKVGPPSASAPPQTPPAQEQKQ